MSILDSLITDRTSTDAARWAYLKPRVMNGTATDLERGEWLTALKGAYNYTDWNRVGAACAYIFNVYQELGYNVPGYTELRTDFTVTDLPTEAYWTIYINTVAALKAVWPAVTEIPETMARLGVDGANNIENLFLEIDELRELLEKSFIYSGECWSGEF